MKWYAYICRQPSEPNAHNNQPHRRNAHCNRSSSTRRNQASTCHAFSHIAVRSAARPRGHRRVRSGCDLVSERERFAKALLSQAVGVLGDLRTLIILLGDVVQNVTRRRAGGEKGLHLPEALEPAKITQTVRDMWKSLDLDAGASACNEVTYK